MTLDLGVAGQTPALRMLEVMLNRRRLPHALLFSGPPNSGKTTLMRNLAAHLNCAEGGRPGPCQRCPSCTRIARDVDFDVTVIDVAAGHGQVQIDQIRQFERRVALTAVGGGNKIGIFPSAHLFTENAANALLKTLEQPPAHTLIMLAAPSPDAVLPTVVSRCSLLRLYALGDDELRELVKARTGAGGERLNSVLAHAFGRPGWAIDMLSRTGAWEEFCERTTLLSSLLDGATDDARRIEIASELASDGASAAERREKAIESLEWLELSLAVRARERPTRWRDWANNAHLVRTGLRRVRGNAMLRPAMEDIILNLGRLRAEGIKE